MRQMLENVTFLINMRKNELILANQYGIMLVRQVKCRIYLMRGLNYDEGEDQPKPIFGIGC